MKTLKVLISLDVKGDADDTEALKTGIYEYLQELIEDDELEYEVIDEEDEEEDF